MRKKVGNAKRGQPETGVLAGSDSEDLRWVLDAQQSRAFAELLLNPPEPTKALRDAAKAHGELFNPEQT
jgi:Protein of unknown function (DUF1778)